MLCLKPEHQQLIVDAGALPHLVALLKRHRDNRTSRVVNGVIREAVGAIANLARRNGSIKTRVKAEGGIPPLLELLESNDAEVQMVVRKALLIFLASKNEEYKKQVVDDNFLPTLILMLQSEDTDIHYEAVRVIGDLVNSSPKIKRDVLHAGALQPVIKLLSSTCLESQRKAALILRQFTVAPEYHQLIVDAKALPHLVALLKRHRDDQNSELINRIIRITVDAITNLARENGIIKTRVRVEGGIPPLVELLESNDAKVQRAAVGALHVLASKNDENMTQIVDHNALPALAVMLESEDTSIQYEAVCVIGCLVNSSPKIKMDVLQAGALQPLIKLFRIYILTLQFRKFETDAPEHQQLIVDAGALHHLVALLKRHRGNQNSRSVNGVIREVVDAITNLSLDNDRSKTRVRVEGGIPPLVELLKSNDAKVQRIAARALCILISTNYENKTQIVDHYALPALAVMLESEDTSIQYEAVTVIGNLANSSPKIKMYVLHGALQPLVKLLSSTCLKSQRKAVLLLGQFAADTDMKDNIADLISVGGVQNLMDGEFIDQPTRACVAKILKRMEDKIHGKVLSHLLYKMHNAEKIVQKRIALALAHFCSPDYHEAIFVDNNGLDLLLELIQSVHSKHQGDGCAALCRLAEKATSVSLVDAGPSSPISQVYLGEEYVNNPLVSDVTFIVEGKRFYAHRIVLLASSDAFRAMFDGGYKERDAKDVQIPNISWETFELMMRFIYTGSVELNVGIAKDLLKAADQYLLDGLKRLCEYTMAQNIKADNLALMYDLSETSNAVSLRNACILFVLEQFNELHSKPWYASFLVQILPEIRNYFMTTLANPIEANLQE
ncbi:ARM REPEAT PROTEIN INTERACTING WITH ABF2 [Artemisia annua]|uniref:ARM REPEAT PROTEIN INTERACTING WITH ABF2 n=1 Tax=Artemisia annua TaxID=35608 RepID=A0A2U1MA60_ARTAN|nr:ARM REPEAT PROTEIN INTERACTING WITH ABF2 [Artemisia annua]